MKITKEEREMLLLMLDQEIGVMKRFPGQLASPEVKKILDTMEGIRSKVLQEQPVEGVDGVVS